MRSTISEFLKETTEVPELQDVPQPNRKQPPPYSPNAWAKLAHFLAGNLSGGYFQDHRGDFRILHQRGQNVQKCLSFYLVSQLQGRNSKIASVILKVPS